MGERGHNIILNVDKGVKYAKVKWESGENIVGKISLIFFALYSMLRFWYRVLEKMWLYWLQSKNWQDITLLTILQINLPADFEYLYVGNVHLDLIKSDIIISNDWECYYLQIKACSKVEAPEPPQINNWIDIIYNHNFKKVGTLCKM